MIYLMKDEKRNGTLFKVGYTRNMDKRMVFYNTHNPQAKLLETVVTYKSTKHNLETAIRQEIKDMGYEFQKAEDGTKTEWFFVDMEHEKEFEEKGLAQFKACRNRKIYKKERS